MAHAFGQHNKRSRSESRLKTLSLYEVAQTAGATSGFPIVISGAVGARVKDADANRYIDLTSFFGVSLVGHRNKAVVSQTRQALGHLIHTMGDVHPDQSRTEFLKMLCGLMPAPDYRGILSLNGSDAVECALKFAAAATGRGGVIAFEGSYHGLSSGALEVTSRQDFREPFKAGMSGRAVFAPWPTGMAAGAAGAETGAGKAGEAGPDTDKAGVVEPDCTQVLEIVKKLAVTDIPGYGRPGALIIEPIQGRGGMRQAPPGFLPAIAAICKQHGVVFITDEIYSGTYRTGTFLAGDSEGLAPDIVCLGKALGGGFPLSVAMMRPDIAGAVKSSGGEAVHTSTFMGWPMSCAAGIAVLKFLGNMDPVKETARIETQIRAAVDGWTKRFDFIKGIRGRGAMLGIITAPFGNLDCGGVSMAIVGEALSRGLIVLPEGAQAEVVAITPPLIISDNDLKTALKILEQTLETVADIRPPFAQDTETRRDEKTIKYRKKPK